VTAVHVDSTYILLPLVAFAAFIVKGVTGFGPAIVVVAVGSLLLPPQSVIALSAMLDATAGLILYRMDPLHGKERFWIPLTLSVVVGAVGGGLLLAVVPTHVFRPLLGVAILVLALWFYALRSRRTPTTLAEELPERCSGTDIASTVAGGVMGGLLGITGPPILWHFGKRFGKRILRQTLIPIFLADAVARVVTYTGTGFIGASVVQYYVAALPGLFAGLYVGNRLFGRVSEAVFSRIVGLILLAIGLRLLVQELGGG